LAVEERSQKFIQNLSISSLLLLILHTPPVRVTLNDLLLVCPSAVIDSVWSTTFVVIPLRRDFE